jgi:hypothetical protein
LLGAQLEIPIRPPQLPAIALGEDIMKIGIACLLAAIAVVGMAGAAGAAPRSVKNACAWDYRNFCSQWGLNTAGLNNCMRRNGRNLSAGCVRSLVAAGKISAADVERKRVKYGR